MLRKSRQVVVAGGYGAVDIEMTEHAFDAVAFPVEDAVVDDRLLAVRAAGNDGLDFASAQIIADGIGLLSLVSEQGGWLDLRQRD